MIKTRSIRNRVLIRVFLLFLIIWAAISYATYAQSSHEVEELFDSELAQIAGVLQQISTNLDLNAKNIDPKLYKKVYGHRYEKKIAFQIFHKNNLLLQSANAPAKSMTGNIGFSDQTINNELWRVFRLHADEDQVVITAERYDYRQELVNEITGNSLFPLTLMIPILLIMIWVGIDRGLLPLRKLANHIAQRSPDNLEPIKVNFNIPTEILPLFSELNKLFNKLENAFERERRFTSDAAHELQTPLASVKTQVQVALRSENKEQQQHALEKTVEGIDRATHMVQQLLALARLEPLASLDDKSKLDINLITQTLISELDQEAHKKQIELELNSDEQVCINGNQASIEILIRNLLSNAIRYSPHNGSVIVNIQNDDRNITFSVTDTGPGIAEQDRDRVFERFYRGTDNQHIIGSGLGLSIARRIAELHDTRIEFAQPANHKGLKVIVRFKAA
jgi:two-component system sensor histidine kinase QseC